MTDLRLARVVACPCDLLRADGGCRHSSLFIHHSSLGTIAPLHPASRKAANTEVALWSIGAWLGALIASWFEVKSITVSGIALQAACGFWAEPSRSNWSCMDMRGVIWRGSVWSFLT